MPLTTAAEARKVSYQTARNFKRSAQEAGDDWDIAYGADLPGQHALSTQPIWPAAGGRLSRTPIGVRTRKPRGARQPHSTAASSLERHSVAGHTRFLAYALPAVRLELPMHGTAVFRS
ncbi:DUF1804 family protein [Burkholderia glumae]|nr:DUF1804 family protein [Burkholderia glumae]MCM2484326.1 DUF1804 family protein [Burkholderia glumae]MCM2510018.1 DUF1804 family protein [Burkholderia glumae]